MDMTSSITPVRIGKTRITDPLFGAYVDMVAEKVIPYQWEALNDRIPGVEKGYCIENFRVAAGLQPGHHQGAIFQDTDLYKWLEAVAFCIEYGAGEKFVPIADEVIALMEKAQEPDGYLNTYFTIECPEKKWTNLTEGHELYGCGHLIEAAVAYYNATGKDKLLNIACRFADLVDRTFGAEDGKCHGYPGHQEIELALVKLYKVTGEKRYLNLANYFIRQRGTKPNYLLEEMKGRKGRNVFPEFAEYDDLYAQTHEKPVEQTTAVGHAVRAVYMYTAMADLARELDDQEMLRACQTLYDNITTRRMYITGGIGSSGKLERFTTDYDLPNDRMYCESCASVGLMMFSQRMGNFLEDARFYDTVERALCNTVLGGISKDADRYFYVNPLEVWPDNCLPSTSMSHVKPVRQGWFSCACCPPNIARTLASLGQYIYAQSDDSVYVNMFISSKLDTQVGDKTLGLDMQADYMNGGDVTIRVTAPENAGLTLKVRIPWYLENPMVNGEKAVTHRGYVTVPVNGDTQVVISGSVKAKFVAANRNVRADVGKVALMKGPYVYCLEQVDNGCNLASLFVSPEASISEAAPEESLPGNLPTLLVSGERLVETIATHDLYGNPAFRMERVTLKAIPYPLWCNREPGEMMVWLHARV